jgi:hypothetical protein
MWYEDRQNLVALANYLKDDGEWRDYSTKEHKDDPANRMIYFLSKPWKWQEEWEQFQQKRSEELCQQKL